MIRRSCTIALAAAALFVSTAPPAVAEPATLPMAAAVRMRVPTVEFNSVALVDFTNIHTQHRLRPRRGRPEHPRELAGPRGGRRRSVRTRHASLAPGSAGKVLDLALRQVSGNQAGWYVSDHVIHITTRDLADRDLVTQIYPVQDLIVEVPNFAGPTFQLGGNSGGNSGGSGQSLLSGSDNRNDTDERTTAEERGEQLVQLIMMLVSPEVWSENGGYSRIRYFNGDLIVTAPRHVQAQIGK
jgi:hypothetical protein